MYYQRMTERAEWQSLLMRIPWVKAMPYHLVQDMSSLLFEQDYFAEEVVYDVDDPNCDQLYFVLRGRLRVQAKVTVEQQTVMPTGHSEWTKKVTQTEVHYLIRQLNAGQHFGLEELVEIGCNRLQKVDSSGVKRRLRVTAMENCKLVYMNGKAFFRLFGEMELEKLKSFVENVNLQEIVAKVQGTWKQKQLMQK
jgi:CRP-like cAMP-binding protein